MKRAVGGEEKLHDASLSSKSGCKAEQTDTLVRSSITLQQTRSISRVALPRHVLFGKKISSLSEVPRGDSSTLKKQVQAAEAISVELFIQWVL